MQTGEPAQRSRAEAGPRGAPGAPAQRTPPARRTQAERSGTTRAAVLASARQLFGRHGYAATGREDIAARAGVTRGALYHHFSSKADLFSAVVQRLDDELVELVMNAAEPVLDDPLEALCRAAAAYVEACADPNIARIVVDAPSVLSFEAYRALNVRSCQALLVPALRAIRDAGGEIPGDPEMLAPLVLALLNEAGCMVASTSEPQVDVVTATVIAALTGLFGGRRQGPARRRTPEGGPPQPS